MAYASARRRSAPRACCFPLLPDHSLTHRGGSCKMAGPNQKRSQHDHPVREFPGAVLHAVLRGARHRRLCERRGWRSTFRLSSDPDRTAAALRSGEVEVMWGGPLRVLLTHDADPASDVVCFCDVVARDPFFVIGREPRPSFRPADLTRSGWVRCRRCRRPGYVCRTISGAMALTRTAVTRVTDGTMAANALALRAGAAGCRATVPALCGGSAGLGRGASLVCGREPGADGLYDAGDAARRDRAETGRIAGDGAGDAPNAALDPRRHRGRKYSTCWRRISRMCRRRSMQPRSTGTARWSFTGLTR